MMKTCEARAALRDRIEEMVTKFEDTYGVNRRTAFNVVLTVLSSLSVRDLTVGDLEAVAADTRAEREGR